MIGKHHIGLAMDGARFVYHPFLISNPFVRSQPHVDRPPFLDMSTGPYHGAPNGGSGY